MAVYKYIDRSVEDNSQRCSIDTDTFRVQIVSMFGRRKAFSYAFDYTELLKYNPTFNQSYNIREYLKGQMKDRRLDKQVETVNLFDRILDSQCKAVKEVLKQREEASRKEREVI